MDLVQGTEDPAGTFERWMQRDARFDEMVPARARSHGYPVMLTDGSVSVEENHDVLRGLIDVHRQ